VNRLRIVMEVWR